MTEIRNSLAYYKIDKALRSEVTYNGGSGKISNLLDQTFNENHAKQIVLFNQLFVLLMIELITDIMLLLVKDLFLSLIQIETFLQIHQNSKLFHGL